MECKVCHKVFDNNLGGQLTNHLLKEHGITMEDYVIEFNYGGTPPVCACGLCCEKPAFVRGKFATYALGHREFAHKELLYVEKFGNPKCLHCGKDVGFYRGEPKQFCSFVCSGSHNGGFTQKETQDKIKAVVFEKYGVSSVLQIDGIGNRNGGPSGWKHTPQALEKISAGSILAWEGNDARRSAFKKIMHDVRKRNWQDPAYRETILEGNLSGKHSKLHKKIASYLGLKDFGFESEKVIFRYRVDEVNFEKKIIIEINGDYIHANPNMFEADDMIVVRKSRYLAQDKWGYDQKRAEALEALGFTVFVIWESDDIEEKKRELFKLLANENVAPK